MLMWLRDADEVFLCLDAATGKTIWKTTTSGGFYDWYGKGSYTGHPAISDGLLIVTTTQKITYCLNANTGEIIWSKNVSPATAHIIVDGVLINSGPNAGEQSMLYGVDAQSGEELWRKEDAVAKNALPVIWENDGKKYCISAYVDGKVICVEPQSGNELWVETNSGFNLYSPVINGDYILLNGIMTEDAKNGTLTAYKISKSGLTKEWSIDDLPYHQQRRPVCVYNDLVYFRAHGENRENQDTIRVIDLKTGRELAKNPHAGIGPDGFIYAMNDKVFVNEDASHTPGNTFRMFNANPDDFRFEGEYAYPHQGTTAYWPFLMTYPHVDGRVFLRGGGGIFCYDLRDPNTVHTKEGRTEFSTSNTVHVMVGTKSIHIGTVQKDIFSVRIYNMKGVTVFSTKINSREGTLTLPDLSPGMHCIELQSLSNKAQHFRSLLPIRP